MIVKLELPLEGPPGHKGAVRGPQGVVSQVGRGGESMLLLCVGGDSKAKVVHEYFTAQLARM